MAVKREADEETKPNLCFVFLIDNTLYQIILYLANSGICMDRTKINSTPLFSKMPTRWF